ncbi:MAG: glutamine-hydrolyzing carbamoyl-phosphate synthase small subunit [Chloroflexi bacterium]|nr:glutamine-hydrolyzing carbamoyl-phosphate synthase small subunit [Chloroflexota bacterium]
MTRAERRRALLVLEDGATFAGYTLGAQARTAGEVVFNTAVTGYQEVLTDPSYAGQIVVMTYPLIGNYGVNPFDVESPQVQVRGFVVREDCPMPSHWQSTGTLHDYLAERGIVGICGVDTRALTRRLRTAGVMMGTITSDETAAEALERMASEQIYDDTDFVRTVSTERPYRWEPEDLPDDPSQPHIVVVDGGLKYNILRSLRERGCRVTAVPCTASAEDILSLDPAGVLFSPGPGDPALLDYLVGTARRLIGQRPIMGICLGHQVLARALGGTTHKLKFGHRGANHPVRDLLTGRVHITSQNHGYTVDADSLPPQVDITHVSLNDGTVEGFRHRELPILTIQYHSEASPGPRDNVYLFDRWLELVRLETTS